MPVKSCKVGEKPGYRYGESGKCYTYEGKSETSRRKAKQRAHVQGSAVQRSQEQRGTTDGQ